MSPSPIQRLATVYLLKGLSDFPHCTLQESGLSSNSLTVYLPTCGKFCLRHLSLITETCAPVSSKTEDNLLFSKTLMRQFTDPLANTSSSRCIVKVKMALHTCLWSSRDCI